MPATVLPVCLRNRNKTPFVSSTHNNTEQQGPGEEARGRVERIDVVVNFERAGAADLAKQRERDKTNPDEQDRLSLLCRSRC